MPSSARRANRCIEPDPGSTAFAVLESLEFVDSAGSLLAAVIDGIAHLDLRIDATVEAVMSDRLWEQEQRNGEQAQAADGCQHGVGVGSHHFPRGEGLVVVVGHDLAPCFQIYIGISIDLVKSKRIVDLIDSVFDATGRVAG